jgi:predicted transcriptional regulator
VLPPGKRRSIPMTALGCEIAKMKCRLSAYLEPALMAQLSELAKRKKQSMSLVTEAAIASFLTPDEDDRREAAIVRRLDRLNRQVERLERDLLVSVEAMALFIRCWVTVTSSMPDNLQELAQAKGRDRFASFLQVLGQRLATGQRISNEVSADMRLDAPVQEASQK